MDPSSPPQTITSLSPYYTIFLLYIEPLSTILGALYASFLPSTYLTLTTPSSPPTLPLPTATRVSLAQLANLYALFALNEGLVLRCTSDLRVWRTLLLGLLLADFGHLASLAPLGPRTYYAVWQWNAMDAGNVGFVYLGALTRICFLAGLGVRASPATGTGSSKSGKVKR